MSTEKKDFKGGIKLLELKKGEGFSWAGGGKTIKVGNVTLFVGGDCGTFVKVLEVE